MKSIVLILLLAAAGAAAYVTRPGEPAMRAAANALLKDPHTVSEGVESVGAAIDGDHSYDNYVVAAHYTVRLGGSTLVGCWGAFTATTCSRSA